MATLDAKRFGIAGGNETAIVLQDSLDNAYRLATTSSLLTVTKNGSDAAFQVGNLTVSGTMAVTGAQTFTGAMTVTGALRVDDVTDTTSTITGSVQTFPITSVTPVTWVLIRYKVVVLSLIS